MEYKDYYKIMGVKRDATQDEIKRAYRKLARLYHPDISKVPNAEQKFKEAGEAYEVLKDPEKRAAYDQLGANWKSGQEFRPPPNWDSGFEFSGGGFTGGTGGFSDFFESLFGQAGGAFRQAQSTAMHARGEDRTAKVLINLEDAYHGATQVLTLRSPVIDREGHVKTQEHRLKVKIPKGIKQGQRIRLAGQGAPGLGNAPAGDLYLNVAFKPHPFYHVEGGDVYLDLPTAPWEIILGASIQIPTPEGPVQLKIPPNAKAGQKLRLKGRGIPAKNKGDLYVVLNVALPPAKDKKTKALYEQMAQDFDFNPRAHLGV